MVPVLENRRSKQKLDVEVRLIPRHLLPASPPPLLRRYVFTAIPFLSALADPVAAIENASLPPERQTLLSVLQPAQPRREGDSARVLTLLPVKRANAGWRG